MTARYRRMGLFFVGLVLGAGLIAGAGVLWRLVSGSGARSIQALKSQPSDPGVVYLSPSAAPELWLVSIEGNSRRQLTDTSGKIYDFAVWPDGSRLVYSATNALNGLSLWSINRNGGAATLLLDCGADRCFEPVVSPDGRQIAYSRKNGAENPGGSAGISRIWLIDPVSLATSALYADARIAGTSPSWSPDGRFLAFYNPREGAIQIHALDGAKDRLAATQVEGVGGWSPDSQRMIYAGLTQDESSAAATLSQIDVRTGEIRGVLTDLLFVDFGEPVFSPDGGRIAVGARSPGESSARHVWVFDLMGGARLRISEDQRESQGGYHWDQEGRRLIYQQLFPGSASQPPDVFVFDLSSRTAQRIAQDAFLPAWLPGRP